MQETRKNDWKNSVLELFRDNNVTNNQLARIDVLLETHWEHTLQLSNMQVIANNVTPIHAFFVVYLNSFGPIVNSLGDYLTPLLGTFSVPIVKGVVTAGSNYLLLQFAKWFLEKTSTTEGALNADPYTAEQLQVAMQGKEGNEAIEFLIQKIDMENKASQYRFKRLLKMEKKVKPCFAFPLIAFLEKGNFHPYFQALMLLLINKYYAYKGIEQDPNYIKNRRISTELKFYKPTPQEVVEYAAPQIVRPLRILP